MLAFNQESKWDGFKTRFPLWEVSKEFFKRMTLATWGVDVAFICTQIKGIHWYTICIWLYAVFFLFFFCSKEPKILYKEVCLNISVPTITTIWPILPEEARKDDVCCWIWLFKDIENFRGQGLRTNVDSDWDSCDFCFGMKTSDSPKISGTLFNLYFLSHIHIYIYIFLKTIKHCLLLSK